MRKTKFVLAFFVAMLAQQADSFGKRSERDQAREQHVSQDGAMYATFKTPTGQSIASNNRISGKWYHAISCPAWSGRYIYHIRQYPGEALQGFSVGISFGAKGRSSEIIAGKALDGKFEFMERADATFIAVYNGMVVEDGAKLSGTYINSRSGVPCHFVMKRF